MEFVIGRPNGLAISTAPCDRPCSRLTGWRRKRHGGMEADQGHRQHRSRELADMHHPIIRPAPLSRLLE